MKWALETSTQKRNLWIWYVNDVLAILPHGDQALNEFLIHLNSQHLAIQFTMEEEDQKIALPNVQIKRKGECHYLSFPEGNTHQPKHYLQLTPPQWDQIRCQPMPSNQSREDLSPQQIAPRASAPESCLIGQWVSYTWLIAPSENTPDSLFSKDKTSPPSCCTMSKVLVKQVCRHLGIQTTFKSRGALCEALVHTKQPQSALKRIGVVHQVPCADCNCV